MLLKAALAHDAAAHQTKCTCNRESARALTANPFLVQLDAKKIPVGRTGSDSADWLLFTALAGHKGKRAVAWLQRFEAQHHHIAGRIVALFRASGDVIAAEVTIVSTAGQQIWTVGTIGGETDLCQRRLRLQVNFGLTWRALDPDDSHRHLIFGAMK
jgi:hypothetical protein